MLNDFQKIEFCRLKHTLSLRRQFNASSRSEPGRSEITAIAAYQPEADIDVHLTQAAGGSGVGGRRSGVGLVTQTLEGPFSFVSKPIFVTRGAFFAAVYKICERLTCFCTAPNSKIVACRRNLRSFLFVNCICNFIY